LKYVISCQPGLCALSVHRVVQLFAACNCVMVTIVHICVCARVCSLHWMASAGPQDFACSGSTSSFQRRQGHSMRPAVRVDRGAHQGHSMLNCPQCYHTSFLVLCARSVPIESSVLASRCATLCCSMLYLLLVLLCTDSVPMRLFRF